MNEYVNPPHLSPAIGFSHAVVSGGGKLVFLAGQTALDTSGTIVGDDIVAQFDTALGNLLAALEAAGGSPTDLVSLTIYAVDLRDYRLRSSEIGAVWKRRIGRHYPAMAAIGISHLWDEEALVEIQGVAVLPEAP